MADINCVTLTGRLGADPELRFISSGKATSTVSLAVSGFSKDKTDWVRVVFWEKTAEILSQYCKKGDQIGVTGRLQVRQYEQDGQKRTATEVVATGLTMLGGKREKSSDDVPF